MVTRNHRMQYKKLHDKLYEIWDRYENEDEYTNSRLLRESSNLVGTGPIHLIENSHVCSKKNKKYQYVIDFVFT
ncbi:hypothetical protein DPMN_034058 [Dreissena polymorpha]|uniref:Uncharacterized protein n=1 Tax=Dreissena polymorpha TaxID=45954 RepID=A0A9D4M886_DREPO|nr:hypothetical protein DPMN_034058 [Dreissena polymorpha]